MGCAGQSSEPRGPKEEGGRDLPDALPHSHRPAWVAELCSTALS